MENVKIHHVNFFELRPSSIRNIAYDDYSGLLAASRLDQSIEVWDVRHKPFYLTVVPPHETYSVESLAWSNGRLFYSSAEGYVTECDVATLKIKACKAIPAGNSAWCIAVNRQNTILAAGTESGYLVFYDITDGGFEFMKLNAKQEARTTCLDWHVSGEILVSGSIDAISIYNVASGLITERINVGRSEKQLETYVWSVVITKDMTIVSGDSRGKTCFWNGKNGTLISESASHKADVLAVCLSKDEKTVYSSGVDPVIVSHTKSNAQSEESDGDGKWVKSGRRVLHTHDVYAMQMTHEYLVSGGIDSNLVFSKYPPKVVLQYSPYTQSYAQVSRKSHFLALRFPDHLEIYKVLETPQLSKPDAYIKFKHPVTYAHLKCRNKRYINCCAISSEGMFVAYSSNEISLKLIHFSEMDFTPVIKSVKQLPRDLELASSLTFLSGHSLVFASMTGKIHIIACSLSHAEIVHTFEGELQSTRTMVVTPDDKYLAVSSFEGKIVIYNLPEKKVHCYVPHYKCPMTVMTVDLHSKYLMIAYSDRKIVEFDFKKKGYSDWCNSTRLQNFMDSSPYSVKGISYVPLQDNLVVFYDENLIYLITKNTDQEPAKKRPKVSESQAKEVVEYQTIEKFKYLLDMNIIGNEMLCVEISPEFIQENLPPPLYQKKYGT